MSNHEVSPCDAPEQANQQEGDGEELAEPHKDVDEEGRDNAWGLVEDPWSAHEEDHHAAEHGAWNGTYGIQTHMHMCAYRTDDHFAWAQWTIAKK